MKLLSELQKPQLEGKRVLLRADLDVPIIDGQIGEMSRLQGVVESINYITKNGGMVILVGHMGRPKGVADSVFSLKPVADFFAKEFHSDGIGAFTQSDFSGWNITPNIILLENIRFYKGEEENTQSFCEELAKLGDIFVNDAFAVSHREQSSIVGVAKLLPHFAGFRLEKEIKVLSALLKDPKRPLVVIIGGAKLETKLPLVEKMHHFADFVLVGGKIAQETRTLLKVQHEKTPGRRSILLVADLNEDLTDITPITIENFKQVIQTAKTIVWNGPVGKTDGDGESGEGTLQIAHAIVDSKAYSVVGGGDTLSFLEQHNLLNNFDFASTGGGAMLAFLSGEKLPGIEVLNS